MNPLPNEWAIKHRADFCAATQRPFAAGEHFYTLLYHDAEGYRREDLSEEAWRNRNENIRPFSFWKSRYEPLPPKAAEVVPKENAEQLFRRLIASKNPPANACYVLAAMQTTTKHVQGRARRYWKCVRNGASSVWGKSALKLKYSRSSGRLRNSARSFALPSRNGVSLQCSILSDG